MCKIIKGEIMNDENLKDLINKIVEAEKLAYFDSEITQSKTQDLIDKIIERKIQMSDNE